MYLHTIIFRHQREMGKEHSDFLVLRRNSLYGCQNNIAEAEAYTTKQDYGLSEVTFCLLQLQKCSPLRLARCCFIFSDHIVFQI